MLAPCHPAGPLCHLVGEGGGGRSLSPTSSKLLSSHSRHPSSSGQTTSAAPVPTPPRYPIVLLETRRHGVWDTSAPCFQDPLSPLPGSYTRACTKAPFTPPAPPSAPPSRPAALPFPTRRITVLLRTLLVVTRTRAVFALRAATRANRHSPFGFLLAFCSCPPAPSKARPFNYPRGSSYCV